MMRTGIKSADKPAPAKNGAHTSGSFDLAILFLTLKHND
jgi:hypothetical protein